MALFTHFGVVVASHTFLFNIIKKVLVSMRFRKIPVLGIWKALLVLLKKCTLGSKHTDDHKDSE